MARKKPPVVTSPWKVGFFVSLMLVALGIGVAYFFMRTFALSWGMTSFQPTLEWLRTEVWGGFPAREGLLFRIWPLLAMIGVTAMLSHFLISRAVSKYKSYLDSGLDYKNLLSSIREVEDLDDKKQIAKLKNHPELKRFLMRLRDRAEEQETDLEDRERAFDKKIEEAEEKMGEELGEQLAEQCVGLIDSIRRARPGHFSGNPAVTMAELKRVEDAVCEAFQSAPSTDIADQLRRAGEEMQGKLAEITRELQEDARRAKEIGKQIGSLAGAAGAGADPGLAGFAGSLQSLDNLSGAVLALSEDTKGIAINTAMQASSGQGGQAELVQLAEDVKEIAAKFADIARSYSGITAEMKESMSGVETQGAKGSALGESTNAIADKVAVLAERTTILADKIANLQDSYKLSSTATTGDERMAAVDTGAFIDDGYGFETADSKKPLFSDSDDEPAAASQERTDDGSDVSEPGEELFADLAERETRTPEPPKPPEEPVGGNTPLEDTDTREAIPFPDMPPPPPPAPPNVPEPPLIDPVPVNRSVPEPPAPPAPPVESVSALDPQEVVMEDTSNVADLYAIGAVDFDPVLHG